MSPRCVRYSSDGHSARIELDRPEAGNRVTLAMLRELADSINAASDSGADVLLLTSVGASFCLGRDRDEVTPPGFTRADAGRLIVASNEALAAFPGISVAAVQGEALGYGCGLAIQADITIAADIAVFAFNEIHHGSAPRFVMSYLEDYVGRKRALELVVTGRTVDAAEALQMGLASRVVPADQLTAVTADLLSNLTGLDASAMRTCKRYLREVRGLLAEERFAYAVGSVERARSGA